MSDLYAMSDEELLNQTEEQLSEEPEETTEPDETTQEMPEDTEEVESPEAEEDDDSETDDDEEETESEETDEDFEEGEETTPKPDDTTDNDAEEDVTQKDSKEKETTGTETSTDTNYEEFYKVLTKPFRANGKDMTVTNPEDIISLMQQGANYSQKMSQIKPQMAIIKTLQEHDLTDPAKLSYLIDLHNKDPKAIAKLVKESDIDLYEFDMEQGKDYVPSEKVKEESALESVIDELNLQPSFQGLLSTVSNDWDTESKAFVANNPSVLRTLTQQRESGLYKDITDAVEYERMCGRLNDVPYIEAYSIMEQKLGAANPASQGAAPAKFTAPRPNTKAKADNAKKRKASSPKGSGQETNPNINMLEISDEELMKLNL